MTEQILTLTLEIICLLAGEDYAVVKKTSGEGSSHPYISRGWSRSPPTTEQKILDITYRIIELLTGEVPMRCQDVAVFFTTEEWEYVEEHKGLYKDLIVSQQPVPSAGGTDERPPIPIKEEAAWCDGGSLEDPDSRSPPHRTPLDLPSAIKEDPDLQQEKCITDSMEETASCDGGTSAATNTNATSDHPQQQHHMKGEPATQETGALPAPDMGTLAARTQHPATGIKEESVSRGAGNSTATNTDCPSTPSIKAPVTPERSPPGPTGHAQQYPSTPTMGEPVSCHAGNITGSNIYSSAQPAVSLEGEHLYNNYGYIFTEHTYTHPSREALRYGAAGCAEDCIDSLPHTVGASTSVGGFSTEARPAELQYVSNHVRSADSCPAQAGRHHAFLSKCLEYENHFCKVSCAGICGTHLTEWAFNCSECHNCLNATPKLIRQSPKPPQVKRKSAKKTSSLEKKEFACLECGKHFPNKRYLLTHRRVHSQESPFHCPACGQSFQNQEGFVAHQRSPACEKPFCCSECGKRFKSRYNSEYHKKIHTENKKYLCPVCGKGFRKQSCFIVHERTHTGEKPYACPECGRCFSQNASLISHQRLHTGEKPFTCLECGRNFTQRISLVVHQRVHSGDRPYKCQECGKGFTQRIGLVQHQRRHTGEKPFTCSECGKSFTLHDSLVKHLRTHTGEKPYVCSECGKRFCQSSQLTAHKRFHHATRHNSGETV